MKTPQLENGYIRIATEIIDNFQHLYLSANEWKILWTVIRKTYGWGKKEDRISISQFQETTKLSRPNAHRAIKSLVAKSIIVAKPLPYGRVYSLNKLHTEWKNEPSSKYRKIVAKSIQHGSQIDTQIVAKPLTNSYAKLSNTIDKKDTIQKILTKDNSKDVSLLVSLFKKVNPSYEILFKNKTQRASAQRLIDQYGIFRLSNLMEQLPSIISKPYAPTITTPYELEVKMGALISFIQKEKIKVNKFSVTKI